MDLSIIILSYNTRDITDECLVRLKASRDFCQRLLNNEVETVVVDNASSDGSVEMIKQKYPWVKLIALPENTGFSKGNNIGIKESKKPNILLLNSDTFLEQDSLLSALQYMRDHKECAVLGPRLMYNNGKFQESAGFLPTPLNIIFWIFGISFIKPFHPKHRSFFTKERQVGWVTGAFLMTKRKVLERIGGFDENFFMYLEEVELCKRIADANLGVCYAPQITVTHLKGASSQFDQTRAQIEELEGIKYYLKKHHAQSYLLAKLFLILGLILRIVVFALLGKTARARAYIEGLQKI